jgi:hypothetical protein
MLITEGRLVFPALAIPVEGKDEFSCPTDHIERLRNLLPRATRVVTIGWRATEAGFLQMLHASRGGADLMIVSGSTQGAEETYNNLCGPMYRPNRVAIDSGFTGLIQDLEKLDEFLR